MTGFGRGEAADGHLKATVEIKCVNHRYSDYNFRLPREFGALEEPLRNLMKEEIKRGRADVFLSLEDSPGLARNVTLDANLARRYYELLSGLREELGIPDPIQLEHILRLPDIVSADDSSPDQETVARLAEDACRQALSALVAMRVREGQSIWEDLKARLAKIEDIRTQIEARSGGLVGLWRERLMSRLAELMPSAGLDAGRIEQEVAVYADRSDISEELVRLSSHIKQMDATLDSRDGESVGRRLDFICQEMLREVNTVGSKALDSEIASGIIAAKEELERIREQLQNIE